MKHVFVVDDEKSIRDILQKYIENAGYKVTVFTNGEQIVQEVGRLKPDLLVIDIMMPGTDGLAICREIRKSSELPIIFVTAKGEEFDRVLGLELGADDYMTKPFSPRELVVRIKNIFKRLEPPLPSFSEIRIGNTGLHKEKRIVEANRKEIPLTAKEYELFVRLAANPKHPFTREQLIEQVWGFDFIGDDRLVDDLVKRVRKKLQEAGSTIQITTVWGYGYRLDGEYEN